MIILYYLYYYYYELFFKHGCHFHGYTEKICDPPQVIDTLYCIWQQLNVPRQLSEYKSYGIVGNAKP